MSNSNNPSLPYLSEGNDRNVNNNQSNNITKNNSDTSNFLEDDESTAAPPPAYEDVVKPQPALPGYNSCLNNQPNPPPPAFPVSENYNQISHTIPANSNEKSGHRVCHLGHPRASRKNNNCCCGWIIVLMIFIILGSISVANNNACKNINLSDTPVGNFSFDPAAYTILKINADNARMRVGEVRIFQGLPADGTLVNIEVYAGSKGATPKYDTLTRNDVFELIISQADGSNIFDIPPRCMRSQINVLLPSNIPLPITIQVRNLDIKMIENPMPYIQDISLITEDRNIQLDQISSNAQSMNIRTNDGDITGSIINLPNELSFRTNGGDLKDLHLGIAQNANPKITVKTDDGNVELKFINPFSGNYNIQSNGRVNGKARNHLSGSVINVGNATLNVISDEGDIFVNI